jgi:hypothetical protein
MQAECVGAKEAIMNRLFFVAALAGLTMLLASGAASSREITYSVDCSKRQTISGAIDRGDARAQLVLRIKGTCNESVLIERYNVELLGDPEAGATIEAPEGSPYAVAVEGHGVTLENLTIIGGNHGVRNSGAFRMTIRNSLIQDAVVDGIRVFVGDVRVQETTIQGAGENGLRIMRGGSVAMSNSQILDNARDGIYAEQNAAITANNNTISGNQSNGVTLHSASQGDFGGNEITRNQGTGLLVQAGSTADIDDNTIFENQGDGIIGYLGATLVLHGNDVTGNWGSGLVGNAHSTIQVGGAHISSNLGDGIVMVLGSKLILEDPVTEVFLNGNYGVWCGDDESSVNEPVLLNTWGNTAGEIYCTGF